MACDVATDMATNCLGLSSVSLDPGWLSLLVILVMATSVQIYFYSISRVGLIRWCLAWQAFVLAVALSLIDPLLPSNLGLSLPLALALSGLFLLGDALGPDYYSIEKLIRVVGLSSLVLFALVELFATAFGRHYVNLLALMSISIAAVFMGLWLMKRWLVTQKLEDMVILLVLIVMGLVLVLDTLDARFEWHLASEWPSLNSIRAPSDWFLVVALLGCLISTVARLSLEFAEVEVARRKAQVSEQLIFETQNLQSSLTYLEESRAISMLSATLAHELMQPVTAMAANVDILERYKKKLDHRNELLQSIVGDIERDLVRTTTLLADYLRPNIMPDNVQQKTSAVEVIQETLERFEKRLSDNKVQVITHFDRQIDLVGIDSVHLSQILINVLRNAMQAMENDDRDKQHEIEISTFVSEAQVVMTIRDNGPGIAAQNLPKLDQLIGSKKAGGLGFGLAISRWLIERSGGKLSLWSDQGKGFFVQITLPKVSD